MVHQKLNLAANLRAELGVQTRQSLIGSNARSRGAAWSARYPVTVEIRGSNPLENADDDF